MIDLSGACPLLAASLVMIGVIVAVDAIRARRSEREE